MKKIILILLLAVASKTFGQTDPGFTRPDEQRNPLLILSMDLIQKDTISADSLIYFAEQITLYRPRFAPTMFAVVRSTDGFHDYIFQLSTDGNNNFVKVPLPINKLAFYIDKIELGSNGPGKEMYDISCKIVNSSSSFNYQYDISKGIVTAK